MQDVCLKFEVPLIRGTLIKRYKRFLADVMLEDGTEVTVHVPNSGSMLGLSTPGIPVALSISPNLKRKLKHTLEMVKIEDTWVGVNTQHPNAIVEMAFQHKIPEFSAYATCKREVKYDENSRIDLLLRAENHPDFYVEVKNVTLKIGDKAAFPDAVTARGTKHLQALTRMIHQGHSAALFYLVQRDDCTSFQIAKDIDPTYFDAFNVAIGHGLKIICYSCHVTPECIKLNKILKYEP